MDQPTGRDRQQDSRGEQSADDDLAACVKEIVDSLPPLTEEQRDQLALLFRSRRT